ncbi:MAG: hypothetical protein ACRELA_12260, partial [Candidatus Rokuibacteriota bacterium]
MKPRNREINIFNMSLLDILCGALGVVCFLMLGLFTYHKPLSASGAGSSQSAEAENQRLRRELQALEPNRMRNPVVVYISWAPAGHDADLYVRSSNQSTAGKVMPEFSPTIKQERFFTGDERVSYGASEIWLVRDNPTLLEYKIHYRLFEQKGDPQPTSIWGVIVTAAGRRGLPEVTLTQEKTGVFVGTLVVQAEDKIEFKSAIATPPKPPSA